MGSTRKNILLPIILLFVLIGCATTQQREETLRSKYPDWSAKEIESVAKRDVEPGMTTDMVKEALGRQGDTKNGPGMEKRYGSIIRRSLVARGLTGSLAIGYISKMAKLTGR